MDPEGEFYGDTLICKWNNPVGSRGGSTGSPDQYIVVIEQCNRTSQCKEVVNAKVNSTTFEMTSAEKFGPCTFYTLKVRVW